MTSILVKSASRTHRVYEVDGEFIVDVNLSHEFRTVSVSFSSIDDTEFREPHLFKMGDYPLQDWSESRRKAFRWYRHAYAEDGFSDKKYIDAESNSNRIRRQISELYKQLEVADKLQETAYNSASVPDNEDFGAEHVIIEDASLDEDHFKELMEHMLDFATKKKSHRIEFRSVGVEDRKVNAYNVFMFGGRGQDVFYSAVSGAFVDKWLSPQISPNLHHTHYVKVDKTRYMGHLIEFSMMRSDTYTKVSIKFLEESESCR